MVCADEVSFRNKSLKRLYRIDNVKYLDISFNKFRWFPTCLLSVELTILDISNNELKYLPDSLGTLNSTLKVHTLLLTKDSEFICQQIYQSSYCNPES